MKAKQLGVWIKLAMLFMLVGCSGGEEPGTEQVDTGTEQVDTGTEQVDTGTEQVDTGTELVDTGTELVDTGTELVDTGTELVDTASIPGIDPGPSANSTEFVHPGITHKLSDLERIRAMVNAGVEPWASSYEEMAADSKASYDYQVQGDPSFTELGRDNKVNYGAWNSDIRAAYYNAIRWVVTGDERYAQKAIEIFNAWVGIKAVTSNGTRSLSGGVGYIMIEAAEIIRSTYDGWAAADQQAFKDMLVYPGYSNTAEPDGISNSFGSFYWQSYQGDAGRHGNQGLSGWRTVMAMGIFLDNRIMFDRALRYIRGLPHRPDDIPYPTGPSVSTTLLSSTAYVDTYAHSQGNTIEDYGYNEVMTNYIWENGQCQESSRDQQHVFFGLGLLLSMSEMAWNQGEDLYSNANDRLLLGLEYTMRYNVSANQSFADQATPWEPTVANGEFMEGFDRTGRWYSKAISPVGRGEFAGKRPIFELAVAHYVGRGFKTADEARWIVRGRDMAIEQSGYETAGWTNDALGWGALTARRPDGCVGDPISGFDEAGLPVYRMHQLPGTIEAENMDYSPVDGEGRTHHDTTSGNNIGLYRSDVNADIDLCYEGGFAVEMDDGEWITYTVNVPTAGKYDIVVRYAASETGGVIQCFMGGADKTGPVALGATGGDQQWVDQVLASGVSLSAGVQSLKVVTPTGGIRLSSITVR